MSIQLGHSFWAQLVTRTGGEIMQNINFVPDEYIQNSESQRTNLIYLVLLIVVMAGLVGSFASIKVRQRLSMAEEKRVNAKMAQVPEALKQSEDLQEKYKAMMK